MNASSNLSKGPTTFHVGVNENITGDPTFKDDGRTCEIARKIIFVEPQVICRMIN
jgi:hypothetical protein